MPNNTLDDSFLGLLFNRLRGGAQPTGPNSQYASDDSHESWYTTRTSLPFQKSSENPSSPPASSSGTHPQVPISLKYSLACVVTPAPQGFHAYPLQEPSSSASPSSSNQCQPSRRRLLRVNPLLSRSSRAQTRIAYDIIDRPGPGNVLDRLTRRPFALAPLLQPATYPPTVRLILHSDKFPNVVVVDANVCKLNTGNYDGGRITGVGAARKGKRRDHRVVNAMQYVSILDVLHAVYTMFSTPLSPTEWSALGGAKSWKAAKAYGRRMQAGGNWRLEAGCLSPRPGETALVGVETFSVVNIRLLCWARESFL